MSSIQCFRPPSREEIELDRNAIKDLCEKKRFSAITSLDEKTFVLILCEDFTQYLIPIEKFDFELQRLAKFHVDHTKYCPCCSESFSTCSGKLRSCGNIYCRSELCPVCQREFRCAKCGQFYCEDHEKKCVLCSGMSCERCSEKCSLCEKKICVKCRFQCFVCVGVFCKECRKGLECSECSDGERVCGGCVVSCAGCDKVICTKHQEERTFKDGTVWCWSCKEDSPFWCKE